MNTTTTHGTTTRPKVKRGRAGSPALQAQYDKARQTMPPIIKGVSTGRLITLRPADFSKVDVDRRYQRDKIDGRVSMFMAVLQGGGSIPDPISLVKYNFAEVGIDSSKFWIVDGQQRFFAHMELGLPIQAMLYEADSVKAVGEMFLAAQNVNPVAGNRQVMVSGTITATLVREAAAQDGHPLFGRVALTAGTKNRLAATTIARGMMIAAANVKAYSAQSGVAGIQAVLSRTDATIKVHRSARERAEAFLRLAGLALPDSVHSKVVQILAGIAFDRWSGATIRFPTTDQCARLRKVNWHRVVPSFTTRFEPVIEAEIRRIWK